MLQGDVLNTFFFEEGVSMEYNFDTIPVKKTGMAVGCSINAGTTV